MAGCTEPITASVTAKWRQKDITVQYVTVKKGWTILFSLSTLCMSGICEGKDTDKILYFGKL